MSGSLHRRLASWTNSPLYWLARPILRSNALKIGRASLSVNCMGVLAISHTMSIPRTGRLVSSPNRTYIESVWYYVPLVSWCAGEQCSYFAATAGVLSCRCPDTCWQRAAASSGSRRLSEPDRPDLLPGPLSDRRSAAFLEFNRRWSNYSSG